MKLIMILQEEKIKASIKDFWDMVELRLKMLQNKSKEIHDLPEWTKIIRIENIFRQCDKTCVFIMDQKDFKKDPVQVALFTIINSPNSWTIYKDSKANSLKDHVIKMSKDGMTAFHGAYMVNAPRNVVMNSEQQLKDVVADCIKQKLQPVEFHDALLKVPGIADFMAHQIVINLQLTGHLPYDPNYVKLGPGSSKGLKLLGLPEKEESLQILLKQIPDSVKKLTPKLTSDGSKANAKKCEWNLETIENCLCIYQKMLKFRQTGKTKRTYTTKNNATHSYNAPTFYK